MKPSQIYTFTVPANSVYGLSVIGEYFKLLATDGAVNIKAEWGELKGLVAGQGLKKTPFQRLEIRDASGANNVVRLFVGDEEFIDGLGGSVSVSQAVVARSSAFDNQQKTVGVASASLVAPNAARQALQIQNKSASGNVYLAFGKPAVIAGGVRVVAGGVYEPPAGVCPTTEIFAIGDIAGIDVTVVEG